MTVHGGDIWRAEEATGIPALEIIDFSANINPRGLPPAALARLTRDSSDLRLLSTYPDPQARRLRSALGTYLGIEPDSILIGPGAEALLSPIMRSVQPKSALIPIPAFSEYRRVCNLHQIDFRLFPLDRNNLFQVQVDLLSHCILTERHGMIVLNNPHNPSGAMLEKEEMKSIVAAASDANSSVVLDEAFIDYASRNSMTREAAEQPDLIVLRSLTKFFGCPALRVGYAVSRPDTIQGIQSLLPTWPVTQLALETLAEALTDRAYAEASLRDNVHEREQLATRLAALGLFVFPSAANYLLVELPEGSPTSSELRTRLLTKHRILIRNCDSYEGMQTGTYIRLAIRTSSENDLLVQSLREELSY